MRETWPPLQPWLIRRTMASAMATRQRRKPSRMTLSENVARTLDQGEKGRRRPGPFAGMNQRVASVREMPQSALLSRGSKPTSRSKSKGKDDEEVFHALKMQSALSPLSYNQRTVIKQKLDKIQSFDEFNLRPDVKSALFTQALAGMTELVPTPAQKLAIPALLAESENAKKKTKPGQIGYDQFLIAAETGSGKTLAYLLPVLDAIKRQEVIDKAEEEVRVQREAEEKAQRRKENVFEIDPPKLADPPHATTGRPRALILMPSSELVSQVGGVVKLMSHTVKYRSAPISSNNSPTVIRNRLFNPNGIDVIVSTPHLISSIAEKEPNILSRLQYLVVDEADSLLDRSFSSITTGIIDRAAPSLKQLILCSATIPRSLEKFLDARYPEIKRLVTPKLHSIPRRVQLGVVDIEKEPYRGNRMLACAEAIWQLGRAVHDDNLSSHTMKNIIVFVNERESAEEVAKFLATKGIDVVALTRDTSEQRQNEVLSPFTSPVRVEGEDKDLHKRPARDFVPFANQPSSESNTKPSRRLENTKVLVTTDLGSRGIDTLAVRNVILYDVPHSTIDFVHRLGRLGRMGRRGRAVALVGKKDRKDVISEVRHAMFKGQALI